MGAPARTSSALRLYAEDRHAVILVAEDIQSLSPTSAWLWGCGVAAWGAFIMNRKGAGDDEGKQRGLW